MDFGKEFRKQSNSFQMIPKVGDLHFFSARAVTLVVY